MNVLDSLGRYRSRLRHVITEIDGMLGTEDPMSVLVIHQFEGQEYQSRLSLLERFGRRLPIRPEQIARSDAFFARRGDQAVLVGRMVPVVRSFISLSAGVAKMPVGRFAVFMLIGSLPWTFAAAAVGYAVAANWKTIASDFSYVSIAIGAVLAAFTCNSHVGSIPCSSHAGACR